MSLSFGVGAENDRESCRVDDVSVRARQQAAKQQPSFGDRNHHIVYPLSIMACVLTTPLSKIAAAAASSPRNHVTPVLPHLEKAARIGSMGSNSTPARLAALALRWADITPACTSVGDASPFYHRCGHAMALLRNTGSAVAVVGGVDSSGRIPFDTVQCHVDALAHIFSLVLIVEGS